jgi:microsomal epoxide hydrolase
MPAMTTATTAGGCDVGALVTGQLGHKYADELYGIHIGSALKLTLFNGYRAWDLSGGRPIPENLPPAVHEQIVALESASPSTWPCPSSYANNNRYPWTPSHHRWPVIEALAGITFVAYENPLGVTTSEQRIQNFLDSDRAAWYDPRQRHRSRPRRAFHPLGDPQRVGRRPAGTFRGRC